ncbi:radical SAM family heme chaperone HemW [Bacteroidota bacterium]
MAGLYIHIPFCRDACTYCDFHFSISLNQLEPMLQAINKEIITERDYLEGEELETIYLGGGTPSLLTQKQIEKLFTTIRANYSVNEKAEITLEANPDDLDPGYLSSLRKSGINRLSIGIQSFFDEDLELMNRRHTSSQSKKCLESAYSEGFNNLNLDLIYGMPGMSIKKWQDNLKTALEFKPKHIAAYHLTYEPGTELDYRRSKNRVIPVDENRSYDHYSLLVEIMETSGYEHYEISNFALPGYFSKHNSAYWKGEKYLGIGPSAHSYNGLGRRWNIAKNASYIRGIKEGNSIYKGEFLEKKDRFHDYLMTSLRTSWGVDMLYLRKEWGDEYCEHILKQSVPYVQNGKIVLSGDKLILSTEGMFIADHILREMFI